MILSLLTSKLLVPKYLELATEIIQSAMTDPVQTVLLLYIEMSYLVMLLHLVYSM